MAFNPPLQVVEFIATRRGDPVRGPLIRLRRHEATIRNVTEGELVWVYGPRRHDLATVEFDETVPRGCVIVRDLSGLAPSEIVRLVRTSDDRPILAIIA